MAAKKEDKALMDPDLIKQLSEDTNMDEKEVAITLQKMKDDNKYSPQEALQLMNADAGMVDKQQRAGVNSLTTLIKGLATGNFSKIKLAMSAIPGVGGKLVPFRSFSEIQRDQIEIVKTKNDMLYDQIIDFEEKRSELNTNLDNYTKERTTLQKKRKTKQKELTQLRTKLTRADDAYNVLKEKIKSGKLEKIADVVITAENKRNVLEEQEYKLCDAEKLLMHRISQISNNIEFTRLFKESSNHKIRESKILYNNIEQKLDVQKKSLKLQQQGAKITETAIQGAAELATLETLANNSLIIYSKMDSVLVSITQGTTKDFYSDVTLAHYMKNIKEMKAKRKIINAQADRKEEEKDLSLTECYEELGLSIGECGTSKKDVESRIQKAYHRISKQVHPDVNREDPQAVEKFAKLTFAYKRVYEQETGKTPNNL